jgi:hypothetical protein
MANELQTHDLSAQNLRVLTLIYIALAVLSRLLPHVPDVTALTSLSVIAGTQFSKTRALGIVLFSLFISDLLLAYFFGYSLVGSWTIFNYSGFILITLFAPYFLTSNKKSALIIYLLCSSFGFWLWTNFGTWLCSGIYPHHINGLTTCYIAALPFLRNAMGGDLIWMGIFLGVYWMSERFKWVVKETS